MTESSSNLSAGDLMILIQSCKHQQFYVSAVTRTLTGATEADEQLRTECACSCSSHRTDLCYGLGSWRKALEGERAAACGTAAACPEGHLSR